MNWANFFLFCFAFGFVFSLVSAFSGHLHFHGGHHGGHGCGHNAGHMDGHGHAHGHTHPHAHTHGHAGHDAAAEREMSSTRISPVNMGTISAFMAWFGGTGYLATRFSQLWIALILLMSTGAGLLGGAVVFWFLSRVLMSGREDLDPVDYDMVGVLGRVTGTIRTEGTGEILFSQCGVRKAAPARSEDRKHIPTGTEVVVTRYEDGVAYVRRWDELANSADVL